MAITDSVKIPIYRESDVINARVIGVKMALSMGFREIALAEIEIIISELGTNIVKHANAPGELIFQSVSDGRIRGIEIIAKDQGKGIHISDISANEGISSEGSLGIGLAGVRRLADEFEIGMENGAVVHAKKWMSEDYGIQVKCSVLSKPKFGEIVSGDAFFYKHLPSYAIFGVIDALGHGPEAHQVAETVHQILETEYMKDLLNITEYCHQRLKGSRGAAIAIGKIDFRRSKLFHIGIGNIETRIYGGSALFRPSYSNGTLGMCIEGARAGEYPYSEGSCIVMFSDGISGRFDIDAVVLRKTVQEISHSIFSRYAKDHDDATVLVVR